MELDLIAIGKLIQKVDDMEVRMGQQALAIGNMNRDIQSLLELANRSRGGFWVGMMVVSAGSALLGWWTSHK